MKFDGLSSGDLYEFYEAFRKELLLLRISSVNHAGQVLPSSLSNNAKKYRASSMPGKNTCIVIRLTTHSARGPVGSQPSHHAFWLPWQP